MKEETITGEIKEVMCYNEVTGFAVVHCSDQTIGNIVPAVGVFAVKPIKGEIGIITGSWQKNASYGMQFRVKSYKASRPVTLMQIKNYLVASDSIKNIREARAQAIVERFGLKTLDIISSNPDRLLEVSGIGKKFVEDIKCGWNKDQKDRESMLFLASLNITTNFSRRLVKKYGDEVRNVIETNPYQLAYDITGIGFATADSIAAAMGVTATSPRRMEAALYFSLFEQSKNNGHLFFPFEELVTYTMQKTLKGLINDKEILYSAMYRLCLDGKMKNEQLVTDDGEINAVYLPTNYYNEKKAASKLKFMLKQGLVSSSCFSKGLADAERQAGITLAPRQREAVLMALENKVSVITGGPGTGKTTILSTLLSIFRGRIQDHSHILLAAPTGRAAKRMTETTHMPAVTIHRLLCYSGGHFSYNEDNLLKCDVIVVDEASMIDMGLFASLITAIPATARLIIVGDADQLPSVGAGNVLADLIRSGGIPVTKLDQIFRQAGTSSIISAAHDIIHGVAPTYDKGPNGDFYFVKAESFEDISRIMLRMITDRIPTVQGYSPKDIQVLTPMNKGNAGTIYYNKLLQLSLNPLNGRAEVPDEQGERNFRVGDKIMQTKNNYNKEYTDKTKGVFNGDIGEVVDVDLGCKTFTVKYDEKEMIYEFDEKDQVRMAYASTIHKSQGSEYPVVIMPVTENHYIMLQRNLLYTGVTRGRKLVILIGTQKAVGMAIHNDKIAERYSYLAERLR